MKMIKTNYIFQKYFYHVLDFSTIETMPKGVYNRTTARQRTSKAIIRQFAEFCLREDVATQLESVSEPWLLAIQLFKNETGIELRPQTAKNQMDKWIMVNGNVYKLKK